MKDIKICIIFLLIFLLMLSGYFIYSNYDKQKLKEENFKFYEYHNFLDNNTSKSDLATDTYLINLLKLDNYYSFKEEDLEELMYYYVNNITKNTSEDIKIINDLSFSLSKKAFISSMEELFNADVANIYEKFKSVDFISLDSNRIYFKLNDSMMDQDYGHFIGVKSINLNNDVITINAYFYTFMVENEETENYLKNKLINTINNGNFIEFNNLIENNYGVYEEKIISFKEIPNGDFFKYQIISISTR